MDMATRAAMSAGAGNSLYFDSLLMAASSTVKIGIIKWRSVLGFLAVSGFVPLISACPFSGSDSNPLNTVTEYHVPERVAANSTFQVEIALAPAALSLVSPQSATGGNAPYQGSRFVSIVDVNPPGPPVTCGGQQRATVGGEPVDFVCTAPSTVPGGNNEHHLQIRVPGTTDSSDTASVEIINDGLVNDALTDSSGAPIGSVSPGQPVDVAFTTNSNPLGVGRYTVEVPEGWTIDGDVSCDLPGNQGTSCKVHLTAPVDGSIGVTDYIRITPQSGSSRLADDYLPVVLDLDRSAGALGGTSRGLHFEYAQNISRTVYANLKGDTKSPTFTYHASFTFKNTSGAKVTIKTADIQGLKAVKYDCAGTTGDKPDCTLADNGYLVVEGTLDNGIDSKKADRNLVVSIKLRDAAKTIQGAYSERVYRADYVANHVAVRIINPGKTDTIVGAFQNGMIKFNKSGVGDLGGSKPYPINFKKDIRRLGKDGGIFYMPYASGAKIYIAHTKNTFSLAAVPSVTASPEEPPYVVLEMSYTSQPPAASCSWGPSVCPYMTIDESYVNSMAILGKINAIGNGGDNDASGSPLTTQEVTFGALSNITTKQLLKDAQTSLDGLGGGWQDLVETVTPKSTELKWMRAPISLSQVAGLDPFASDYYKDYINKLWAYYAKGSHTMYVNASGTGDSNQQIGPADSCVLMGDVPPVSGTSPNAGKLVFSPYSASGTCPAKGYVVAGLPNQNGVDSCGHNGSRKDTKPCADTPKNLVFEKFNDCDFFQATGSGECHELVDPTSSSTAPQPIDAATFFENEGLWGPNGTYRAVVGRAIAAYQAAGLLPPPSAMNPPTCAPNNMTVLAKENAAADVDEEVGRTGKLSSTPCLSGLSIPTYNAYAGSLLKYVDVYTYSYSDFLGRDGTVTFDEHVLAQNSGLPRAQPVTITLQ